MCDIPKGSDADGAGGSSWRVICQRIISLILRLRKKGYIQLVVILKESKLSALCEKVFDRCLAPTPGGEGCDNMTMILVHFKKPKSDPSISQQLDEFNDQEVPTRIKLAKSYRRT
ncbi:hypothetical protein L1987_79978 [Smallanthus sonchifolius]|uniref:Uncharacterized protein n=1 Tax=Smallanthus sonchifolius TaxID=185202 RepID=A0ACB8YMU7_9ASTR|nr:hypothetical protein L1987_79978 [Smallanthus sonchifolius]